MKPTILHLFALLPYFCTESTAAAATAAFLPSSRNHDINDNNNAAIKKHSSCKKATKSSSLHASLIPGMESPRSILQKGMQSFQRDLDVPTSLAYFDKADSLSDNSLAPYLWQRGISYYYLDLFKEGSEQFRLDVKMNPLDVEEIVWDIACLARIDGTEFPPEKRMALPAGKKDRRRIMSTVYSLFRGDGAMEYDLREAGHQGNISDEFYSLFYLGLYCEIRNETTKAETYMKAAASSVYAMGNGAGDYMSSCAKVHCKLRGWVV